MKWKSLYGGSWQKAWCCTLCCVMALATMAQKVEAERATLIFAPSAVGTQVRLFFTPLDAKKKVAFTGAEVKEYHYAVRANDDDESALLLQSDTLYVSNVATLALHQLRDLIGIDVSQAKHLTSFKLTDCPSIKQVYDFSHNTALRHLVLEDILASGLELGKKSHLSSLTLSGVSISEVDLSPLDTTAKVSLSYLKLPSLLLREGTSIEQNDCEISDIQFVEEDGTLVYDNEKVDQPAVFPGGEYPLFQFIRKHISYPKAALEKGVQGTVVVRCVLDDTGAPTQMKIVRSLSKECDAEALRVMRMLPRFSAAVRDGKQVSVYFNQPFRFVLP